MAFDPVSFAMGAKGSGGGGGSGGGATICQCTYDDSGETEVITSTMTAAEMWAACQTGVVVCQYSYETLGGSDITTIVPVATAGYEIDGDDHFYSFSIGEYNLNADSDSAYPTSDGGK